MNPLSDAGTPGSPASRGPGPLGAGAPPPASAPHPGGRAGEVVDVTTEGFQDLVLRSEEVPVLVDFWATWCQPCRTLGPMLEKLAAELAGRFVLAKVDIDREPALADAFRIQSVPTVVLLAGGKVVDGFLGVQPEARIRELLEPHLKAPAAAAADTARERAAAGDVDGAIQALRDHLRAHPGAAAERLALCEILIDADRADEAELVFARLDDEQRATDAARALQARLDLRAHAGDLGDLAQAVEAAPEDVAARLAYGRALVAANRHDEGLEHLYEAALLDLDHDDGAPRKALLEAFQALGPEDPRTLEYQQKLSILLCG